MAKQRVESCLIIGTPLIINASKQYGLGVLSWDLLGWKVNYAISMTFSELRLSFNHVKLVDQEILLCKTTPNYGGTRWWLLCPKCRARVSRIYRPSGAALFLCRRCHNLTYESAQTSGSAMEKFFRTAAARRGVSTREARRSFRLTFGGQACVTEVKHPVLK